MADEDDPFEQYFKPRPAGAEGPGGPVADDSGSWDAVGIDADRAQRVQVPPARARRASAASAHKAVRRRRSVMITAAFSSFVLLGSAVAWASTETFRKKLKTIEISMDGPGESGPKGAMNILLAGVDKRDGISEADIKRLKLGRTEGARSDTMMLMHVSKNHDKVTIVSLPRDSLVTIPAHKTATGGQAGAQSGKLTWAYSYGGAQLMKDTIQGATGVKIDHYVEVNFLGFLKVVDAVGGVEICTEKPINDKASGLKLAAGTHHVDGAQALAFARARHGLGEDIGRMQRQQEFMSALMSQAIGKSKDPVTATKVLNAFLSAVRVDEGLKKNVNSLAQQFKDISLGNVEFAKVPIANQAGTAFLGGVNQSVVLWDENAARKMFKKIVNDESLVEPKAAPKPGVQPLTVPPSQISVRVKNGVGTPGLAKTASAALGKVGFRAAWVIGVAQRKNTKETLIQYGPGREDSARTLAAAIPGARLKKVPALGNLIEVIVGSSWSKPKAVQVAGQAPAGAIETRTATQNLCKK